MKESFHILVMDDDPATTAYLADLLKYFGYEAEFAGSYASAMKRLQERKFHGLLLSVWMEDGRGDSILQWLQENGRDEPVVMMSGLASYDMWSEMIRKGAADLIPKPVEPSELGRVMKLAFQDRVLPACRRQQAG